AKVYCIRHLERVAGSLQRDFPSLLSAGNSYLEAQLHERFLEASTAIRNLELKLALSDESTPVQVRGELKDFLYAIIAGDYGLLPGASPLPSLSRKRKIINICRDIAIAVIPLTVIILVRYLGLKFSTGLEDWVTIVGLIWAIVTIVSLLDPQ